MQWANNDGVQLAYEEDGPADAETVVFAEGLGYGRWMWNWQRDALSERYHTIVWDNRGTGDSDEPDGPYSIDQMASDMEAVLDDAGVDTAHVVGASMGGMIAMQYALDYDRADSLSLLCTSPGGEDAVETPEETQARMFGVPEEYDERESIRYKMRPAMTDEFFESETETVDQIVDWRLTSDASEQARLWQAAGVEAFDVSSDLDAIDVPALVLHGTDDRVLPIGNGELLADGLEDVRFERVEGGPHLFFIEQAETVTRHIREFLADV